MIRKPLPASGDATGSAPSSRCARAHACYLWPCDLWVVGILAQTRRMASGAVNACPSVRNELARAIPASVNGRPSRGSRVTPMFTANCYEWRLVLSDTVMVHAWSQIWPSAPKGPARTDHARRRRYVAPRSPCKQFLLSLTLLRSLARRWTFSLNRADSRWRSGEVKRLLTIVNEAQHV